MSERKTDRDPLSVTVSKEYQHSEKSIVFDLLLLLVRIVTKTGKGILSFFQYTGIQWMRLYRNVFRRIWNVISPLLKVLGSVAKITIITVDTLLLRSFHTFVGEVRDLGREIAGVSKDLYRALRKGFFTFLRVFWYYLCKAVKNHKSMFARVFNFLLPVAAVIVLIECISYWNNSVYALNVEYAGQSMGYIAEESVYYDAMTNAKNRMADYGGDTSFDEVPSYTLELVRENQLTDVPTLCDSLIESSDSVITPACGVYVNDRFLCSVKNETDISAILDGILANYKSEAEGAKIGFAEDIRKEQGLYPVDTLWNAGDLKNLFTSSAPEAVTYTVKAGDTVEDICQKTGLAEENLRFLNPGLSRWLREGTELLLAPEKSYLTVEVTRNESYMRPIAYEVEEVKNSNKYMGYRRTLTPGKEGQNHITDEVTYINGVEVNRLEINEQKVSDPVNQLVEVGTKDLSSLGTLHIIPTSGRFCWPAIGLNSISSGYGGRWGRMHSGVDITGSGAFGKPVVAADYGTVVTSSYHGSFGNHIIIDHGDGYETLYAHMSQLNVRVGEEVAAGQVIGLVGSTGNSTGPHLHFEVHINGRAVNPSPYIGLR